MDGTSRAPRGTSQRNPSQARVATNQTVPAYSRSRSNSLPGPRPGWWRGCHRCPCQDRYPDRGAMTSLGAAALECRKPQCSGRYRETHDRRRALHPPTCTGTHAQDLQPSLLLGGLQVHEASPAGISPVRRRRIYHRTVRSLKGDYNAQNLTCSRGRRRRGRLYVANVAVWVVGWSKL